MKAIDDLNNELVSRAPKYMISESINKRDLQSLYHDDYRQLKELINVGVEDVRVENINKVLSPSDNFSLQDYDFNIASLKNKIETSNIQNILNFEFVGEKFDLSSLVDTLHVDDLNQS